MADWLGADQTLKNGLIPYIQWYAIGILPMLLGQQLASFLQLEHQGKRCYIGITAMILTNIGLDIESMVIKMQETLDLCRKATEEGSPFRIRQEKVIVRKTEGSFVP